MLCVGLVCVEARGPPSLTHHRIPRLLYSLPQSVSGLSLFVGSLILCPILLSLISSCPLPGGVLNFPLLPPVCLYPGLSASFFPPLPVLSVQISVPRPTPFLPISFSPAVTPYIQSMTPPPTARPTLVPGNLLAWVTMCPPRPIGLIDPCHALLIFSHLVSEFVQMLHMAARSESSHLGSARPQ